MIKFQNVTKTYKGSTVALNDCTVEIDKGEFVFLVGPSGSGKTTFIRLLLREEMPDSGRIWEAGKEIGHLPKWRIPYLRRNIGCVFQDFRLLPNKTVFENVAFALEVIGRPKHVIAAQVPQVLDLVGLAKKRDNLPGELSGGEQQRVAVARAFVNRPLILLADEPTGNLDPTTSLGIMRLLDRINRTGTTVIVATHDAGMVNQMRRRVIELDRGNLVRDQAHGVYDIDSATLAAGAGRPPATWSTRCPVPTTSRCPTPPWPVPDGRLPGLRLEGGRHQPVAQPPDDGGRHPDGGRVAGSGGLGAAAQAGRLQGHRAVAERRPDHRLGEAERRPGADQRHQDRARPVALREDVHLPDPVVRLQRGRRSCCPPTSWRSPPSRQYPASFRCELNDPSQASAVYQAFHGKPGVFDVKYPGQQIKTMQSVIRVLQWVFLTVAVVLLLSASVLILNTIRMAIFARRREVSVMKLVGATNWFIRLPFMAEGMIQGLLGAGVAVLVVLALYWGTGLNQGARRPTPTASSTRCR